MSRARRTGARRAAATRRAPYEAAAAALLVSSGCTVRRYRSAMTGFAVTSSDDWAIVVPRPTGPISFGVFAHEVGHQLLHRGRSRVAWLHEVEAWEFALSCFDRFGLSGVERSRADAAKHLRHVAYRTSRRCTPATARALLDRFPAWVWRFDDPREAVTSTAYDDLVEIASRES